MEGCKVSFQRQLYNTDKKKTFETFTLRIVFITYLISNMLVVKICRTFPLNWIFKVEWPCEKKTTSLEDVFWLYFHVLIVHRNFEKFQESTSASYLYDALKSNEKNVPNLNQEYIESKKSEQGGHSVHVPWCPSHNTHAPHRGWLARAGDPHTTLFICFSASC